MTLTVEVSPSFTILRKRLNSFRSKVKGDLLNRVAQRVAKHARDRVTSSKETPDGVSWPERKQPDRFSHPLMEKTRALFRSMRAARQDRETINVGTDLLYGKFQHGGTRRGLVARPALGVGRNDEADLQRLIDDWVRRNESF